VLGWTGHVGYETLGEKSEKNRPLNRPKNRRNIKLNLKAGLLKIIMSYVSLLTKFAKIWLPQNVRNFTTEGTSNSSVSIFGKVNDLSKIILFIFQQSVCLFQALLHITNP
jgi:hypothetical protein